MEEEQIQIVDDPSSSKNDNNNNNNELVPSSNQALDILKLLSTMNRKDARAIITELQQKHLEEFNLHQQEQSKAKEQEQKDEKKNEKYKEKKKEEPKLIMLDLWWQKGNPAEKLLALLGAPNLSELSGRFEDNDHAIDQLFEQETDLKPLYSSYQLIRLRYKEGYNQILRDLLKDEDSPPIIINFAGLKLSRLKFSRLDLCYADFKHTELRSCNFRNANCNFSAFDYCDFGDRLIDMRHTSFKGASLTYISCKNEDFRVWFLPKELTDANLSNNIVLLTNNVVIFKEVRMTGANLDGCDLKQSTLRKLDLTGTSFKKTILSYTNFEGSNLTNADLSDAESINFANFRKATLHNTNLSNLDLSNAFMKGCTLTDCNLSKTKLPDLLYKDPSVQNQLISSVRTLSVLFELLERFHELKITPTEANHRYASKMLLRTLWKHDPNEISAKTDQIIEAFLGSHNSRFFSENTYLETYKRYKKANTVVVEEEEDQEKEEDKGHSNGRNKR